MKKRTKFLSCALIALVAIIASCCFVGCKKNADKTPVEYAVTAPAVSDKYTFTGESVAKGGKDYVFTVIKADGLYGDITVTATMGGEPTTVGQTDDGYKIVDVKGDIVITVTYSDKIVNVTKSECAGATINGATTATVGIGYKFDVTLADGYVKGENFAVTVNGQTVTADEDGYYTVADFVDDISIEVRGAVLKNYDVTPPADSDKYTFTGAANAVHGGDYEFTVDKAADAYGDIIVTATMDGKSTNVEQTDDGYKIADVKGNLVITVTYKDKVVNVTKQVCDGATIDGKDTATVGSEYSFAVIIGEGYVEGSDFEVLINGRAILADTDGRYRVTDFRSGFVIEVRGVKIRTFTATYVAEGVDASALDKSSDTFGYTANKYTVTFGVTDKYSHSADSVRVFVRIGDGVETEVVKTDGAYVIDNPKADITVIIKGLALNKYNVYFVFDGDVFYSEEVTVDGEITAETLNAAKEIFEDEGLYKVFGWVELPDRVENDVVINPVVSPKKVIHGYAYDDKDCAGKTVNGGFDADWSATNEVEAPQGFDSVMKMTSGFNNNGKNYMHGRYSHDDISMFSYITFAVKSNGVFDCDTSIAGNNVQKTTDKWVVYSFTKRGNIWHINVSCENEVYADFDDNAARTYMCDILWHGRTNGFTVRQSGDEALVIYSTEVRAVSDVNAITLDEVTQKIITAAEKTDDTAPVGFMNVYRYVAPGVAATPEQTINAPVADVDVSAYEYLEFYVKCTSSWTLFDGWSHYFKCDGTWTKVEVVKNSATQWTVSFVGEKGTDTIVTTDNAVIKLSDVLTFVMDRRDSTIEGSTIADCAPSQIYVTELRGRKPASSVEVKGTLIADSVYKSTSDNAISLVKDAQTTPDGFENVYAYKSSPKTSGNECFVHGLFFARDNISDYAEVYFAMKVNGVLQLDGARKSLGDGWLTFRLTQNDDGTWNLAITDESGKTVHSAANLTGDSVWKILWSDRVHGYCPMMEIDGISLKVWVTEVRGTLKA